MQMAEELGMLGLGVPDGWMARRPSSGRLVRSCGLVFHGTPSVMVPIRYKWRSWTWPTGEVVVVVHLVCL